VYKKEKGGVIQEGGANRCPRKEANNWGTKNPTLSPLRFEGKGKG